MASNDTRRVESIAEQDHDVWSQSNHEGDQAGSNDIIEAEICNVASLNSDGLTNKSHTRGGSRG